MNETMYMLIMKVFMVMMPVSLLGLVLFARACIRADKTNNPMFWMTLMCISMLTTEIVRGWLILNGTLPPHPKNAQVWMVQLLPFGGLCYAIMLRVWKVVKKRGGSNND